MEAPRFIRLMIGIVLIIFALGLLFGNLGLTGYAELIRKMFWPLIVIAVGLYLFLSQPAFESSKPVSPGPTVSTSITATGPQIRESKIAGELHLAPTGPVQKVLADLAFGKIVIDLTTTIWEEAGTLDVQGLIGEIDVLIPAGLGVDYNLSCSIGAIRAEGRQNQGIGNSFTLQVPPAAGSPTINLRIGLGIGEIKVYRI